MAYVVEVGGSRDEFAAAVGSGMGARVCDDSWGCPGNFSLDIHKITRDKHQNIMINPIVVMTGSQVF